MPEAALNTTLACLPSFLSVALLASISLLSLEKNMEIAPARTPARIPEIVANEYTSDCII